MNSLRRAFFAAAAISFAATEEIAIGFSQITCLPESSAATACSA